MKILGYHWKTWLFTLTYLAIWLTLYAIAKEIFR